MYVCMYAYVYSHRFSNERALDEFTDTNCRVYVCVYMFAYVYIYIYTYIYIPSSAAALVVITNITCHGVSVYVHTCAAFATCRDCMYVYTYVCSIWYAETQVTTHACIRTSGGIYVSLIMHIHLYFYINIRTY